MERTEELITVKCQCERRNFLSFTVPVNCVCGAFIEVGDDGKVHGWLNDEKFEIIKANFA